MLFFWCKIFGLIIKVCGGSEMMVNMKFGYNDEMLFGLLWVWDNEKDNLEFVIGIKCR